MKLRQTVRTWSHNPTEEAEFMMVERQAINNTKTVRQGIDSPPKKYFNP